jgi:hypothetical protein
MLQASCVRCSGPVPCADHEGTAPLWRPEEPTYEAFAEHLAATRAFPTYLPWPMAPGWSVTDFAAVGESGQPRATLTCVTGTTELDGPVDVIVVAEEAGTGLGGRCAGTRYDDPGAEIALRVPTVRVRIGQQQVNLWDVSTSTADGEFDRSVVAGEAGGRWLWLVFRPASALLMLRDGWFLRDVARGGPELVEVQFGGPRPAW